MWAGTILTKDRSDVLTTIFAKGGHVNAAILFEVRIGRSHKPMFPPSQTLGAACPYCQSSYVITCHHLKLTLIRTLLHVSCLRAGLARAIQSMHFMQVSHCAAVCSLPPATNLHFHHWRLWFSTFLFAPKTFKCLSTLFCFKCFTKCESEMKKPTSHFFFNFLCVYIN